MTLFELDEEMDRLLQEICDPETGEINEEIYAKIESLEIDRADKIDGWCFYLKQRRAEIDAYGEIIKKATEKLTAMKDSYSSAKERLCGLLGGEKYKSAYNSVFYKKTTRVELDEGRTPSEIDAEYLNFKEPELNKQKIKAALGIGIKINGVHEETTTSMVIR